MFPLQAQTASCPSRYSTHSPSSAYPTSWTWTLTTHLQASSDLCGRSPLRRWMALYVWLKILTALRGTKGNTGVIVRSFSWQITALKSYLLWFSFTWDEFACLEFSEIDFLRCRATLCSLSNAFKATKLLFFKTNKHWKVKWSNPISTWGSRCIS